MNPEIMGRKALHPWSPGHGRDFSRPDGLGHSSAKILKAYPYLEEEDLREALAYAAWRVEEIDVPLSRS